MPGSSTWAASGGSPFLQAIRLRAAYPATAARRGRFVTYESTKASLWTMEDFDRKLPCRKSIDRPRRGCPYFSTRYLHHVAHCAITRCGFLGIQSLNAAGESLRKEHQVMVHKVKAVVVRAKDAPVSVETILVPDRGRGRRWWTS